MIYVYNNYLVDAPDREMAKLMFQNNLGIHIGHDVLSLPRIVGLKINGVVEIENDLYLDFLITENDKAFAELQSYAQLFQEAEFRLQTYTDSLASLIEEAINDKHV